MSNIQNIKALAEVAHSSGNYEQSYSYFSRVLEDDIENPSAWISKGVATAHLTGLGGERLAEARALITRGVSLEANEQVRRAACVALRSAYEGLLQRLDDELLARVTDYQKVSMPAGGSALVHMAGQAVNKNLAAMKQAQVRFRAVDLLVLACEILPIKQNYAYALRALDSATKHSRGHGDYHTNAASENYAGRLATITREMHNSLSELLRAEGVVLAVPPASEGGGANDSAVQKPVESPHSTAAAILAVIMFIFVSVLIGAIFAGPR